MAETLAVDNTAPVGKDYFTGHPNSTFIVQKKDKDGVALSGQCTTLSFKGNHLYTEDPEAQAQLDATVALPGSPIYQDEAAAKKLAPAEREAFDQVKNRAGDIVEQIAKAGLRA